MDLPSKYSIDNLFKLFTSSNEVYMKDQINQALDEIISFDKIQNCKKQTLLHLMLQNSDLSKEVIDLLFTCFFQFDYPDQFGNTPLYYCQNKYGLSKLIENGANYFHLNNENISPLEKIISTDNKVLFNHLLLSSPETYTTFSSAFEVGDICMKHHSLNCLKALFVLISPEFPDFISQLFGYCIKKYDNQIIDVLENLIRVPNIKPKFNLDLLYYCKSAQCAYRLTLLLSQIGIDVSKVKPSKALPYLSSVFSDIHEGIYEVRQLYHKKAVHGDYQFFQDHFSNIMVDTEDFFGDTPLMSLLRSNNPSIEIAKFLISHHASLSHKSFDGQTPLHLAASCKSTEILSAILNQAHIDFNDSESYSRFVNIENNYGETPLIYAAKSGYEQNINLLLPGSKPDVCDQMGRNIVFHAISKRLSPNCIHILTSQTYDIDFHLPDKTGKTAYCIAFGYDKDYFLQIKSRIDKEKWYSTPNEVITVFKLKITNNQVLLNELMDNLIDVSDDSLMIIASMSLFNPESLGAELFLQKYPQILKLQHSQTKDTYLHYLAAAICNSTKIINHIFDNNEIMQQLNLETNIKGENFLHTAIHNKNTKLLHALINKNIFKNENMKQLLDQKDIDGLTPQFLAYQLRVEFLPETPFIFNQNVTLDSISDFLNLSHSPDIINFETNESLIEYCMKSLKDPNDMCKCIILFKQFHCNFSKFPNLINICSNNIDVFHCLLDCGGVLYKDNIVFDADNEKKDELQSIIESYKNFKIKLKQWETDKSSLLELFLKACKTRLKNNNSSDYLILIPLKRTIGILRHYVKRIESILQNLSPNSPADVLQYQFYECFDPIIDFNVIPYRVKYPDLLKLDLYKRTTASTFITQYTPKTVILLRNSSNISPLKQKTLKNKIKTQNSSNVLSAIPEQFQDIYISFGSIISRCQDDISNNDLQRSFKHRINSYEAVKKAVKMIDKRYTLIDGATNGLSEWIQAYPSAPIDKFGDFIYSFPPPSENSSNQIILTETFLITAKIQQKNLIIEHRHPIRLIIPHWISNCQGQEGSFIIYTITGPQIIPFPAKYSSSAIILLKKWRKIAEFSDEFNQVFFVTNNDVVLSYQASFLPKDFYDNVKDRNPDLTLKVFVDPTELSKV